MKNIFKTIHALAALFVSIPGLHAQIAPDVYKEDPNHPGFVYSKQPEGPNSKGEYTIYLKSFMTGTVAETEKKISSEIVLVLDVSGSMRYIMGEDRVPYYSGEKSRLEVLQESVKDFIGEVQKDGTDNRIAIIKFAGDRYCDKNGNYDRNGANNSDETGANHTYYVGNDRRNYTEIAKGFTKLDAAGRTSLESAVDNLIAYGPTAVDFGLTKALTLIKTLYDNPNTNPTPKEVTNKVVVVFTDGEPNHYSGFDSGVAGTAISAAQSIKALTAFNDEELGVTGKIKVYTIGAFEEDPTGTDTETYMQRVSSNYPNASGMGANQAGTGGNPKAGYYILAKNKDDLKAAFGKISADVATPAFKIKSSASVVDIVAKSYVIPKESDASQVKVYTAPCTGFANNQYTFSRTITDWTPQDATEIGLSVDKDKGEIKVEKFNFTDSDNIVAVKPDGKTYQGNQLIIEIPIKMNPNAVGGQNVQTNAPGSGLKYIDEDGVEQTIAFESPDIHLPINLEIQKRGLNVGESAKFTIQRKWNGDASKIPAGMSPNTWYDYTSVFVTRKSENQTGDNSPSVFIVGLDPNYLFKIKEEGWSWSYGISEVYGFNHVDGQDDPVRYKFQDTNDVTSDKINMNPFIFVNTQKDKMDYIVRHAESIVTNEFRSATSTAKAGVTTNSKAQKP